MIGWLIDRMPAGSKEDEDIPRAPIVLTIAAGATLSMASAAIILLPPPPPHSPPPPPERPGAILPTASPSPPAAPTSAADETSAWFFIYGNVTIVCDDGDGRRLSTSEKGDARRLSTGSAAGHATIDAGGLR